jgi:hypothetical protein
MFRPIRLLLISSVWLPLCAFAGPADYVYYPSAEYGEREIDFKAGSSEFGDNAGRLSAASLGFGLGATQFWFTELYLKYEKAPGESNRFDAVEWENKFQLTETGKYAVDVGLITEIEVPRNRKEGFEFKFGPLFQGEIDKLQWNANLLFERQVGGDPEPDEQRVMQMGYQLQLKYRAAPAFEYGVQAFGEMGKWNNWDARDLQNHRIGPAIFGKIKLGGREAIKYNAAYLFGASAAAPDRTFRLQVEYEF